MIEIRRLFAVSQILFPNHESKLSDKSRWILTNHLSEHKRRMKTSFVV